MKTSDKPSQVAMMTGPTKGIDPVLMMCECDGQIVCHVRRRHGDSAERYGLMLADAARHVAKAFGVDEEVVFDMIEKERRSPTTEIQESS